MYLLNSAKYILQDKPLEIFMDGYNNMDKKVEKFLSYTNELMKTNYWNDEKKRITYKLSEENIFDINFGIHMSP